MILTAEAILKHAVYWKLGSRPRYRLCFVVKCRDSDTNCYHNIFLLKTASLNIYSWIIAYGKHTYFAPQLFSRIRNALQISIFFTNQLIWKLSWSTGQVFVSILDLLIFYKHQDISFWTTKGIESSSVCTIQVPENR